jgi:hypothetical protein
VAALTPLSVDGMIVAASTTLLADSRSGRAGGVLPWALLVAGSVASLAANVAVAEPSLIGRIIAAWPSFALTASYELLTRQVRRSSATAAGRWGRGLQDLDALRLPSPVVADEHIMSAAYLLVDELIQRDRAVHEVCLRHVRPLVESLKLLNNFGDQGNRNPLRLAGLPSLGAFPARIATHQ